MLLINWYWSSKKNIYKQGEGGGRAGGGEENMMTGTHTFLPKLGALLDEDIFESDFILYQS